MSQDTNYIGYRSWNRIRNSGDAITSEILTKLTGLPARAVSPECPHILGVGSILFFAGRNSHVWGSGILNPAMPIPEAGSASYYALRGKKTYSALRELGIALPDLPLGDPGIFAAEVCGANLIANPRVKYRAAFVPHHGSIGHPLYNEIMQDPDFTVVDILDDSLRPLEQILESAVVVSQSLHGLVYAESLGKPNVWISERHDAIWRFKFEDWFSTTNLPQIDPEPLTAKLDELLAKARLHDSVIDKALLAQTVPIQPCAAVSSHFLPVESCRKYNPVVFFIDTLLAARQYDDEAVGQEAVDALSKKVFPFVWKLFKQWGERRYCLIVPADEDVSLEPQRLLHAVRFLDENAAVDFAFVLPKSRCRDRSVAYKTFRCEIDVIRSNPIAGGALLIRPDAFKLTRNYVTLGI